MKKSRKNQLAASFVVTVSAAASLATGCRKQTVEVDASSRQVDPVWHETESSSIGRSGDRCTISHPQHCPKGAMCNPPPPTVIDCPASLRDAGEPAGPSARPPGKEDWLRLPARMWASVYGCGYEAESFCAPPPRPSECTEHVPAPTVTCKQLSDADGGDGGDPNNAPKRFAVASFVYKDGLGTCHRLPDFECTGYDCTKTMPAGETVPCP